MQGKIYKQQHKIETENNQGFEDQASLRARLSDDISKPNHCTFKALKAKGQKGKIPPNWAANTWSCLIRE